MAAGVASGLQNRFGVREVSRVGSIPTRSRQVAGRVPVAGLRAALLLCLVAVPSRGLDAQEPVSPAPAALLRLSGLTVEFPGPSRPVDGVCFAIEPGERLALVGESGCG